MKYPYAVYSSTPGSNKFHVYAPIKQTEIDQLLKEWLASGKKIKKLRTYKTTPPVKIEHTKDFTDKVYKRARYKTWD